MSTPHQVQAHTVGLIPDAEASSMSSLHAISSPYSPTTTLSQEPHSSRPNFRLSLPLIALKTANRLLDLGGSLSRSKLLRAP